MIYGGYLLVEHSKRTRIMDNSKSNSKNPSSMVVLELTEKEDATPTTAISRGVRIPNFEITDNLQDLDLSWSASTKEEYGYYLINQQHQGPIRKARFCWCHCLYIIWSLSIGLVRSLSFLQPDSKLEASPHLSHSLVAFSHPLILLLFLNKQALVILLSNTTSWLLATSVNLVKWSKSMHQSKKAFSNRDGKPA